MKTAKSLLLLVSFVVVVVLAARAAEAGEGEWGEDPVPRPAADLEWSALDPVGAPGVEIAPLWGDPANGGFGAFFKLPAGFAAPLHTHTHDMRLVMVSGTYLQSPEGGSEWRLGPGSYLMQPGGSYRHTTGCDEGADCVFFVESGGAFDLHVVEDEASAD